MRIYLFAAFAAFFTLSIPTQSQAQVDRSHARAWDAHERGSKATTRQATKRATKRTAQQRRSKSIQTRLSPAVARNPIAEVSRTVANIATQILPHPAGCPRRLFCGCGAAVEIFGRPVRHLWLAANWLRFPPAQPAAGMVAANRRHVMVIKQYLGNNKALVYDANSGRGLTRLHVRSLSGYSIRNPRA